MHNQALPIALSPVTKCCITAFKLLFSNLVFLWLLIKQVRSLFFRLLRVPVMGRYRCLKYNALNIDVPITQVVSCHRKLHSLIFTKTGLRTKASFERKHYC